MKHIIETINKEEPASVKVAAMFVKEDCFKVEV